MLWQVSLVLLVAGCCELASVSAGTLLVQQRATAAVVAASIVVAAAAILVAALQHCRSALSAAAAGRCEVLQAARPSTTRVVSQCDVHESSCNLQRLCVHSVYCCSSRPISHSTPGGLSTGLG